MGGNATSAYNRNESKSRRRQSRRRAESAAGRACRCASRAGGGAHRRIDASTRRRCGCCARIAIFDERLREAQSGAVGEIVISGPCLARGYPDDPKQAAEKCLAHPSHAGERAYRMGNLARRLPDGAIQFVGRLDDQVKIRGYLVEPGEVEIAIARQPGVRRRAVVATSPADGAPREFDAFVVPDDPAAPRRPLVGCLRAGVAASLPPFMAHGHFAIIDALPLSANGKTDKAALVAMHGPSIIRRARSTSSSRMRR
ncbi:AMP-binding enzyme family protein [Burkholderia pseudomallei MSHR684]|nr:AMP-binding protein [Burkholderia pseudomallei]KGW51848.1 AMP-binding enzyme family protein [Burkholderia pseudomallei MSHR684]